MIDQNSPNEKLTILRRRLDWCPLPHKSLLDLDDDDEDDIVEDFGSEDRQLEDKPDHPLEDRDQQEDEENSSDIPSLKRASPVYDNSDSGALRPPLHPNTAKRSRVRELDWAQRWEQLHKESSSMNFQLHSPEEDTENSREQSESTLLYASPGRSNTRFLSE